MLDPARVDAMSLLGFLLGHLVTSLPSPLGDLVGDDPEPQFDARGVHGSTLRSGRAPGV